MRLQEKNSITTKFLVWIIIYIGVLLVEGRFINCVWQWDAADYWNRGNELKDSMFNIADMDGFRGYIFILFLALTNFLGGKTAWLILNAILASFCLFYIIPNIGENVEYDRKGSAKVLCASIALVILFVGEFVFPLSDFFAIICCSCSVYFLRKSIESKAGLQILCIFLSGVFAYWAYNTRTIYLFAGVALFAVYIYIYISSLENGINLAKLLIFSGKSVFGILGCFCAAIPQIIANYNKLGRLTASVSTNGLMMSQVTWGFMYQRYDTYIQASTSEVHPNAQVFFSDLAGMRILNEYGGLETWGDFVKLFISHPVDIIVMYFKHGINYLLPCWPLTYIEDLDSPKFLLGLIGATIIFLTILVFTEKCIVNYKSLIYYVPLIVPGLLIIPGAVEYRFSLPLYVFAISQLCFNVDYGKLKNTVSKCKIKTAFLYLLFILFCFAIWSNMLATESVTPLLFQ